MNTDKHRWMNKKKEFSWFGFHKGKNKLLYFISAFICVYLWFLGFGVTLAQTPQPTNSQVDTLGEQLDAAKVNVEKFKNIWDRSRLETTLYDQRAKRAFQKWVKATKTLKAKAQVQRDKADMELQLSVERRKLAFSQWQAAVFREATQEDRLKAFSQDQDTKDIQDKIHQLETKLSPIQTPLVLSKP